MFSNRNLNQLLGGCLTDYSTYAHGTYRGYQIIFERRSADSSSVIYVTINATAPNQEMSGALSGYLQEQKENKKYFRDFICNEHSVRLELRSPVFAKKIPCVFNDIINPVVQYFITQGFTAGCQNCGDSDAVPDCYQINGIHRILCEKCSHQIQEHFEENKAAAGRQKSSLISGLAGAFLGAIIGAALWVGIYKLGYIAGIAGAVTVICALKGYGKFGGAMDVKGIVASVMISVIMIYFANNIAWAWEIYDVFKSYNITFSEAYRSLHDVLVSTGSQSDYYADLGVGYFLTFVCSIGTVISEFRSSKGSYTINKVK